MKTTASESLDQDKQRIENFTFFHPARSTFRYVRNYTEV